MEYKPLNKQLEDSFRNNWSRAALSNYQGDTYTYADLASKIVSLHLAFGECGLSKGDKVAVCARNQANWGVCFLAALTYGAVPVPILHEFTPDSVQNLVNHSEAKILLVGESIWEGLDVSGMPELRLAALVNNLEYVYAKDQAVLERCQKISELMESRYPDGIRPEDIHWNEDRPDELAIINYTSGTSGFSKGVMIPYRALLCNVAFAGTTAEPQMDCNSKVVSMLPSAHMYGMMFEFLFEMTIGAHVYFLNRVPSPKIIMNAFADIHPDIIIAVPLIIEKVYKSQIKPIAEKYSKLIRIPLVNRLIFKKIRNGLIEAFGGNFAEVILGGAAFNPEVEAFFRKISFPFTVGYGMTECAPLITYCKWNRTRMGSCGMAITGCEVRIDSQDPFKIPGEIQVRGDNVFLGYYKNEEATGMSFTEDGWFRTGDMGVVDKDGYLYLRGRSKCMILGPSGQNIYPEELEAVINNVQYVTESLVIDDGGALTALIYPDFAQGGLDGLSAEDVQKRLSDSLPEINHHLPVYAQIKKIEFMTEDFERTPKRNIKRYLYQRN
ncbi:MAG: AMP-binding protein [Bacteroidales bacterium]|nr:AMP-binding protein [Candidatus Cryptobacteroides choladohippi]